MSEFRVPPASYQRFQKLKTKTDKDDFTMMYREWKSHPLTKDLLSHLEKQLEREVIENETKTDFWSRFHFRFSEAVSKGKRSVYRKLLKDI